MKTKRKILLCLIAFITATVLYTAGNVISICSFSHKDEIRPCDTAVVLGAAASEYGVSEVYKQRLNHAADLYREGTVKKIITTGGVGSGNTHSDAYMAKLYLESEGIPSEDILTEDKSTITQENLENTAQIMKENSLETALIVSDPLHMKRAMLLSKDAGINGFSSPTQTSAYRTYKTKVPFTARETFFYIGYKVYRIFI